jgi:phosphatidylglycerol:prolipoprotein diacylglycerol transferase
MRSELVEVLREHGLELLTWIVPTPAVVYRIAMAGVAVLFIRRCRQIGVPLDRALCTATITAVATLLGARLYYLLGTGAGAGLSLRALVNSDGAGSWGGYIGGFLGLWVYARLVRTDPLPYLDVAASAAGLAPIIGRWGCLLAGCDFGRVTSLPWAIHYPAGSHAFHAHVAHGMLSPDAAQSLGVHPLPIYLSLNALVLFVIISAVWRRTRDRPGTTVAVAWVLYGVTRFMLEFLRDPAASWADAGLSIAQWMALVAIGIGVVIGLRVFYRTRSRQPALAGGITALR